MRRIVFIWICMFACIGFNANAQTGNKQVEERVTSAHQKFEKELKLEKKKLDEIDEVFTEFYSSQQKIKQNIQGPRLAQGLAPRQDFQSVRERNEKNIQNRDNRLKKILTPEQYKKWKDDIEPSLRSRQKDEE
ncbi:MAG: hypothetical protein QM727_04820 [Niabella sp.]